MPNLIDGNGLQTKTQQELVSELSLAMRGIYGTDINLDSSTPDGQMMMIFIQSTLDTLDLITQVYNSFDPDLAIGKVLDQRVALNGIQRQAGTFTITDIDITTNQSVTLLGLDQETYVPFTVSDNAGNKFQLINSINVPAAGTVTLSFQAVDAGATLTTPNTINVPVTIILGVTAINNAYSYTTLGINEEKDSQLKIRRQKSVSIASQGYLAGLLAELKNISGLTSAFVYENVGSVTDADGVPSHSIWTIVSGGNPAAIANAIYTKRNAGVGMRGTQTYSIIQRDGSNFIVRWDNVTSENLYIKFDASSLNGIDLVNTSLILNQLPGLMSPGVYEQLNINDLATFVQQIDNNCLVTNAGFSLSPTGPFLQKITPSAKSKKFAVDITRIAITSV